MTAPAPDPASGPASGLATPAHELREHYDVLIIGSGYGGAITAARLGVANQASGGRLSIAVLERGKEHPTGAFPSTAPEFATQMLLPGNPLGLFEFVLSKDFDVVQGNGLGGTSLVNGGVCIIPDPEVFDTWPAAIREEDPPLDRYYRRALRMLGAIPYAERNALPKVGVFRRISQAAGGTDFRALNLAVSDQRRTTRYGIPRNPCVNCGSCISGCNFEAKNTLDKNYLPMARHFGVDLFERMEVELFQKLPRGGYQLSVLHRQGKRGTRVTRRNISCRHLVLAAGCLGSTTLLLRSQTAQLEFSRRLGHNFSGNGDFFALAYNLDGRANFNGWSTDTPDPFRILNGPTITTVFRVNRDKPLHQRLTFEEASMPAPFVNTIRNVAFLAAAGQPWNFLDAPRKISNWVADRFRNNDGAINNSLLYLGMGFDSADGIIRLRANGKPTIEWPGAADDEVFKLLSPVSQTATAGLGGNNLANPVLALNLQINRVPMTGHPIGGCRTAEDVDRGVVDDAGRVFARDGGYHDGLWVIDGSIFPGSIGVNVLLTISAFAERASEFLRADLGLAAFDERQELDDAA